MKRSSQVALVLMGVTATTAAGAYLMPARSRECPPAAQQAVQLPDVALPGGGALPAAAPDDCRRRRNSWGTWSWSARSSDRPRRFTSYRPGTSVGLSPSRSGSSSASSSRTSTTTTSAPRTSTFTSTSSSPRSTTARGGFGSTGRAISSGS